MSRVILSIAEINKQQDENASEPVWKSKSVGRNPTKNKASKSSNKPISKTPSSSTAKKNKKIKTPASSDQPPGTVGRRVRGGTTTWAHKRAMLDWMNLDVANFKLITGLATSDMKHPVAGAVVSKKAGFEQMAEHINQKCGTNWNGDNAFSRYRIYLALYKSTRDAYTSKTEGKFSLTADEVASGMTVERKLDSMCDYYFEMDILFGSRQNVNPSFVAHSDDNSDTENDVENVAVNDSEVNDNDSVRTFEGGNGYNGEDNFDT